MAPTAASDARRDRTQADPCDPCCRCPACIGLAPLERPRFFSGQLLTEEELNSDQAYVLAKSRLHNRYLHGWGVVCGLEVACHECAGWVTVKPGYAIDPCGNDIVVCADESFDFLKSIRDCRRRDESRSDCDPLSTGRPEGCKDVEEVWCLTLAYEEREARPATALRWQRTAATAAARGRCGCGGGSGGDCGCGCGGKGGGGGAAGHAHGSAGARGKSNGHSHGGGGDCGCGCGGAARPPATGVDVCEPTRIAERFRLGTVRHRDACCPDLGERMQATLLGEVVKCFTETVERLRAGMPARAWTVVTGTLGAAGGGASPPAAATYEAVCYLHQGVYDLYALDPHNVRCAAFDALKKLQLPAAPPNDQGVLTPAFNKTYHDQARPTLQALVALVVQYIIDCICHHLLPRCAGDPCDDRLVLACVTVRGDRIINICNFSCRRFAGSFPAMTWWLSAVPLLPLLRAGIEWLCCRDWISANSPVRNRFFEELDRVDPTGNVREAMVAGDFAFLRAQRGRLDAVRALFSAKQLGELFGRDRVNLTAFVNRPAGDTTASLAQRGVAATVREVRSADDIPAAERLTAPSLVERGTPVVAYVADGRVVGFARAKGAAEPDDRRFAAREGAGEGAAEGEAIGALRRELEVLRREVEELRRRGPIG